MQINDDMLNAYNINAADVIDSKKETLPHVGDNIKIRELVIKD